MEASESMFPFQFIPSNQGQRPDQPSHLSFEQQARSLQIIRAALIFGVLVFLGIVLGVAGMPEKLEFDMLEIVLTLFAVQAIALYLFAPKFLKISQDRQDEIRKMPSAEKEKALMPYLMSVEIIRGAAIEGATFFGLILVIIASSKVGLYVGVLLICFACAVFPTMSRIRSQVEDIRFRLGL